MKNYIIILLSFLLSNTVLFSSEKDIYTDYMLKLIENKVVSSDVNAKDLIEDIHILNNNGLLSSFVGSLKKDFDFFKDSFFELFEFSNGENPSISMVTVSQDYLCLLRANFKYNDRKIAHQLIVKTLGDSDKLNIIKFIENLDLGKSKINSEKGNNVLIFKVKNKKGKYDINVLYPENGFINENDNSLMKIRNYVLSILGVNQVYSDFSNMPTRSLQDKLRKNVVYPYKNLDDIIRIFLRGNPNSQKDFYQRIWQYFSSSENFVDNYLAVWIFFINEKFTRDKNLELSFLLETKNKMFISDLRSRNDLLSKYVLYCYYRNKGDLELASEYKTFLLKNKVSDMLL